MIQTAKIIGFQFNTSKFNRSISYSPVLQMEKDINEGNISSLAEISSKYFANYNQLKDSYDQHADDSGLIMDKILKLTENEGCSVSDKIGLSHYLSILGLNRNIAEAREDQLDTQYGVKEETSESGETYEVFEALTEVNLDYERKKLDIYTHFTDTEHSNIHNLNTIVQSSEVISASTKKEIENLILVKDSSLAEFSARLAIQEELLGKWESIVDQDLADEDVELSSISGSEPEFPPESVGGETSDSNLQSVSSTKRKRDSAEDDLDLSDTPSDSKRIRLEKNTNTSVPEAIQYSSTSASNPEAVPSSGTGSLLDKTNKFLFGPKHNVQNKSKETPMDYVLSKQGEEPFDPSDDLD